MVIREPHLVSTGRRVRVQSTILWEDCDRPEFDLWAEVDGGQTAEGFWPNPNGFLLASLLPAWRFGERRVRVEAELCPLLTSDITAALITLRRWYDDLSAWPAIESPATLSTRQPVAARALGLLSCGIDSLSMIRDNWLLLPELHPARIRTGIIIDFTKLHGYSLESTERESRLRRDAADELAARTGLETVNVRTNVLDLHPGAGFFSYKSHGSILAAVAHLFSNRFDRAFIAASIYRFNVTYKWGSHPLLDPYFSTADLTVRDWGAHQSRIEKTRVVANWPEGVDAIQVCPNPRKTERNCGYCEKCVRTMTGLLVFGKLRGCRAFTPQDVTPEMIREAVQYFYSDYQVRYFRQLMEPLGELGRTDLVQAIRAHVLKWKKPSGS
jgi:hypothetical protein